MIDIINVRPIKEVRHFNNIYVKDFDYHRWSREKYIPYYRKDGD